MYRSISDRIRVRVSLHFRLGNASTTRVRLKVKQRQNGVRDLLRVLFGISNI